MKLLRSRRFAFGLAAANLLLIALLWFRPSGSAILDPHTMHREIGRAWIARVPVTDTLLYRLPTDNDDAAAGVTLFENGEALGPSRAPHQQIRDVGQGAYSHWDRNLYFSPRFTADPRTGSSTLSVDYTYELRFQSLLETGLIALSSLYMIGHVRLIKKIPSMLGEKRVAALRRLSPAPLFPLLLGAVGILEAVATKGVLIFAPDSGNYLVGSTERGIGYYQVIELCRNVIGLQNIGYFQLSLRCISCYILYRGLKTISGSIPSFLVALCCLLLINVDFYDWNVLSESTFISLLICLISFLLLSLTSRGSAGYLVCGLLLILLSLTRPVALPLLITVPCLSWIVTKRVRSFVLMIVPIVMWYASSMAFGSQDGTGEFAGFVMIGHIAPIMTGDTETPYPNLYGKLLEADGPFLKQYENLPDLNEYAFRTTNNYNLVLWTKLTPIMVAEAQNSKSEIFQKNVNDIARSIAISVILQHPLAYARLIAAHFATIWRWTFYAEPPFSDLILLSAKAAAPVMDHVAVTPEARQAVIDRLEDLKAHPPHAKWLNAAMEAVNSALIWAWSLWLVPLAAAIVALAALTTAARQGAILVASVAVIYALTVGASQPALVRYAIVIEPLVIIFGGIVLDGVFKSIRRALARLVSKLRASGVHAESLPVSNLR